MTISNQSVKIQKRKLFDCFPQLPNRILQLFILTSQFCDFLEIQFRRTIPFWIIPSCGELRQVAKRSSIMLIVHRTRRLDNVDPISPGAACSANYNVPPTLNSG